MHKIRSKRNKMNKTDSVLLNSLLANYLAGRAGMMLMHLQLDHGWVQDWVGSRHCVFIERLISITPNLGPKLPYWLRLCWDREPSEVSG